MPEIKLDTKTMIFNTALRLFATSGVENVSMRDIAKMVGIKAASIYNHYMNKEQIVDSCYDFFLQHHAVGRLNKEQYSIVLREGTKEEIVMIPNGAFPEELAENLIYSMTILFSRVYTDEKAIDYYSKLIQVSIEFMQEFFQTGIQVGRFQDFNIRGVSLLFLSARLFSAQSISIQPDAFLNWRLAQREMAGELIRILPFAY